MINVTIIELKIILNSSSLLSLFILFYFIKDNLALKNKNFKRLSENVSQNIFFFLTYTQVVL